MEKIAADFKLVRMKELVDGLVLDIKTRAFPVEAILVFGSAVSGGFDEYSDLDICVVYGKELSEREKLEIEVYFRDMVGDEIGVDFIYCDEKMLREGTRVFESIRRDGRVLYKNLLGYSGE